jgi:hypothetical protein
MYDILEQLGCIVRCVTSFGGIKCSSGLKIKLEIDSLPQNLFYNQVLLLTRIFIEVELEA